MIAVTKIVEVRKVDMRTGVVEKLVCRRTTRVSFSFQAESSEDAVPKTYAISRLSVHQLAYSPGQAGSVERDVNLEGSRVVTELKRETTYHSDEHQSAVGKHHS